MISEVEAKRLQNAIRIKYLLGKDPLVHPQILPILNTYEPFLTYPIGLVPPLEILDFQKPQNFDLEEKLQLSNYLYVILAGQLKLLEYNHRPSQAHIITEYLDQEVREREIITNSKIEVTTVSNTILLKIHREWFTEAKRKKDMDSIRYKRSKLMHIPYFSTLNFVEFDYLCKTSTILDLESGQTLVEENSVPKSVFCLLEGYLRVQKRVHFRRNPQLLESFNEQINSNNPNTDLLTQELVRDPTMEEMEQQKFIVQTFVVKELHGGEIICGREALEQQPSSYSVRTEFKSKVLVMKYGMLVQIPKNKLQSLKEMSTVPGSLDERDFRIEYYKRIPWEKYKRFVREETAFKKTVRWACFDDFLRKGEIDLNTKRHEYVWDPSMFGFQQSIHKDELLWNPFSNVQKSKNAFEKSHKK